jgi:surface polysaccharide O-acyltransferase-like enzyme
MWFLWILLVADCLAAALYRFGPRLGSLLTTLAAATAARPARFLVGFLLISAVAYIPLALLFTPTAWFDKGPFAFQLSRPLHYALYFFAGVGLGAGGIDRGIFAADGPLARHWIHWIVAAPATLLAWMGLTGLTMTQGAEASFALQAVADLSFVVACAANCICILAVMLRFAARRLPSLDNLKDNAYGMYLIHYLFVVWLQFAFLGVALPAILKATIVFAGTLALSWGAVAALRQAPPVAQILGAERTRGAAAL